MYNRDRLVIIMTSILLFRIPVSRIIGDNGCGYLSGPMEFFWCLSLLLGAGLTITLRGMMHDRVRRGQYHNASQVFSFAKKYAFISSVASLAFCVLLYDVISNKILLDNGCRLGFIFVGPAVFLAILIDLNIGYLSGTDNANASLIGEVVYAVTTGIGMIGGSILGVHFGTGIADLLHNEEVTAMYGAAGTMAGVCLGELITLIFLMAMTIVYQRSFRHMMRTEAGRHNEYTTDISGRFIFGVLSDGAQELILHLPVLISLILYRRICVTEDMIGSSVGAFYSKYIVVTGILASLGTMPVQASLKGIAQAVNESDSQLASDRITRLFGKITYYAIPAVIFTTMLVPVLVPTVFSGRTTTAVSLLNMGTSMVIIYGVTYCFMSVLIKLGYSREMLLVSAVALVAGTVLSIFLMKKYENGFTSAIIGGMICYLLCIIVCLVVLFRNFRLRLRLVQTVLLPLVIAGIIGVLIKLLSGVLYEATGGVLTLIICIIPAWLIYNLACMFLHLVSASAMSKKFLGPLLVRIGQNLGLY